MAGESATVPNHALLSQLVIWFITAGFLLGLDFLTVSYIGVTPGGAHYGSVGFWRNFYLTSGILIPVVMALFAPWQGVRSPRRLSIEPGGFSYRSLRWVGHSPRRVRVAVRFADIRHVRNFGLGLYSIETPSTFTDAQGRDDTYHRDSVYLDRRAVNRLGLSPEPYRVIYGAP